MLITFILLGKWLEASARGKASEAMTELLQLQPPTALVCTDAAAAAAWLQSSRHSSSSSAVGTDFAAATGTVAVEGLTGGEVAVEEALVSELTRGDVVKVVPGSQVPLDGLVLSGRSTVNEAMVTGEALPVPKVAGSHVVGGTINGGGVLWVGVTAPAAESTLAQIAAVVADAQHRRPRVQAFADRISRYFVPAIVAIALLTYGCWMAADVV
eukprot:666921-Prymnesium_polylepis.1